MTHWTETGSNSQSWSETTDSDVTWTGTNESDRSKGHWTPYEQVSDPFGGVDFVPEISRSAPFSIRSDRPVVMTNTSTITASGYTAEGKP